MKLLPLLVAIVCFILAILYWLPNGPFGHHVKHAILFVILGLLALVWLRFAARGPAR
jgi:hypothetical protein